MQRYEIEHYTLPDGSSPMERWMASLDPSVRQRIFARLNRFRDGNFGDSRHLETGLHEARFHCGPGYRLYFGIRDQRLVLLLGGGDKASQLDDIFKALAHWAQYKKEDRR